MLTTRSFVSIFSIAMLVLGTGVVSCQDFPNKPIRILTTEAGANFDFQARIIAQGISGSLGQPVIVENRPSALLADVAARAAPDGYTVAIGGGVVWLAPLTQKTSYDAVRDFSPITLAAMYPSILVVHPSVPAKSVKELIALAKARPGVLNFAATADPGGASFLAGELFKAMAGINIVRISYKGNASGLIDLLAGEVHFMFIAPASVTQQVKLGKLRALAVTSAEPTQLVPGMPTLAATGLPGYESISIVGILAPAGTPVAIVNRLNQEIVRFLTRADVKEKFFNDRIEVVGSSPAQFGAKIKSEIAKWGKVLMDAGVKVEL